jgi:hypothetical protein
MHLVGLIYLNLYKVLFFLIEATSSDHLTLCDL